METPLVFSSGVTDGQGSKSCLSIAAAKLWLSYVIVTVQINVRV
jgi:hypothetical protein